MFSRARALIGRLAGGAGNLRADTGAEPGGNYRTGNVAYKGASIESQETWNWRPPVTSGDSATLWERYLANARVRDLVRNDPHAVAVVVRLTDMVVGQGLRLAPRPDARALNLDLKDAADRKLYRGLVGQIKSEFSAWGADPRCFNDAQRKLSFNGQLRLMARTYVTMNEATGFLSWREDANARYATCLRIFDPDRLSNPMGQPDSVKMRGGIEFDKTWGEPVAYHVRNAHPADWFRYVQALQWERIPARTETGRPVFIHAFEPDREDQSRAMSPFAALMTRLRMIGKFADTELASATVNALFAAFVTSNLPLSDATQAFTPAAVTYADKRLDYLTRFPPRLNGVRIPVLPIGDEIKINSSPRQTQAFAHFQTAFLQSIASAMGLSYEQVAMDWSRTNYSSARAALNEVWRRIHTIHHVFVERAVMPVYYGVMEEAHDRGYLKPEPGMPAFWDNPHAWLCARWIGPARGYVDPTKEAEAASLRMAGLISNLERECAEQGIDWEDNLDQIQMEEEELTERGLSRIAAGPGHIVEDPSDSGAADAPPAKPQPAGAGADAGFSEVAA